VKNAPIKNLKLGIRPQPRAMNHYRTGLSRHSILGSAVSTGSYKNFLHEIILLTERRKSSYVCFANVHMLVEASKHADFNEVVNNADIVTPDGKPLSIFLRLFKSLKQDRVCGMDVLPDLLKLAENHNKSVYLYGTTDEILSAVVTKAKKDFPSLRIAGYYSPPFRELTSDEKEDVIEKINNSHADLVLVALGCPKQEKWMAEHKGKIFACMLGFGQAFKVYAGMEKRLPSWMRNLSLEWIYRLYLEPKRLWKRYFYTNSIFLLLVFKYMIQRVFSKTPVMKFSKEIKGMTD
jgi:N-acetylglucosaminyldiphosphoundecaprenol N-acetyl-beta-D-mannosaminyltransferase